MALDPPLTVEEEDTIRLIRTLQAKQVEIADAVAASRSHKQQAQEARAGFENLRDEFAQQMRSRGITDPEALLRRNGT